MARDDVGATLAFVLVVRAIEDVVQRLDFAVDAAAGKSGESDGRLRHTVRREHRPMDYGHVRGSGLQQPEASAEDQLAGVISGTRRDYAFRTEI